MVWPLYKGGLRDLDMALILKLFMQGVAIYIEEWFHCITVIAHVLISSFLSLQWRSRISLMKLSTTSRLTCFSRALKSRCVLSSTLFISIDLSILPTV